MKMNEFTVFLLLLFFYSSVNSLRTGDLITSHKRVQTYLRGNDAWIPMMSSSSPRFLQSKSTVVDFPVEVVRGVDNYKISFGFKDLKFIGPYFSFFDNERKALKQIQIIFVYSGDDIIDVKWDPDYGEFDKTYSVTINYSWAEFSEEDTLLSSVILLFTSFCTSIAILSYIIISTSSNLAKGMNISEGLPTKTSGFTSSGFSEQNVFSPIPPISPLASFQPFASSFDQSESKYE